MIEGVRVKNLKVIPDERGKLMEILRCDDQIFLQFGQVYMTTAKLGVVKAWHWHKKQTDSFSCVYGKIKLVLFDARESSPTFNEINEFILNLDAPKLVQIPPMVYHGFKAEGDVEAIVINIPTFPYNHLAPDEYRFDAYKNNIPYDWRK